MLQKSDNRCPPSRHGATPARRAAWPLALWLLASLTAAADGRLTGARREWWIGGLVLALAIILLRDWWQSKPGAPSLNPCIGCSLVQQNSLLNALLDAIPQPVYVRDTALRMVTCNRAYEQIIGLPRTLLHQRTLQEMPKVLNPAESEASRKIYQRVLDSGQSSKMDRRVHLGSEERDVMNWVEPLYVEPGELMGIVGGWVDVTERQQMLKQLAQAKENAESANRTKSAFLAMISHEIRTPLNAILGMLELSLAREDLPGDEHVQLGTAYQSANSLLGLINDILDASKMEAGKFTLHPQPASLRTLTDESVQLFALAAARDGIRLRATVAPKVAAAHLVDPLRFKQILNNLVSNALRFTKQGDVSIDLGASAPDNGRQDIEIVVSDTGIGIPQERIGELFQPFTQLDSSQRSAGGSGLGLTICKRLARKMDGNIGIESHVGQGTRVVVHIVLPLANPSDTPEPTPPHDPALRLDNRHILVVDDHGPNRMLLERQLRRFGATVTTAVNGDLALGLLKDHAFDLVICDYAMPVMDGAAFTEALRHSTLPWRDLPVLGYTASAQQDVRDRALASGMNDVLVKPVSAATLGAALARHLDADDDGRLDLYALPPAQ